MRKLLASLSIVALAALPLGAMADHRDDAEITVPLNEADPATGALYVDVEGPGVWQESNGHAGLQTTDELDEEGAVVLEADSQIL